MDTIFDATEINTENGLALLKATRSAQRLTQSEWRHSALVQELLITDPSLIARAALRTVLNDILARVDSEDRQLGRLLKLRFWEGKTWRETARLLAPPNGLPERTFFDAQSRAVDLFTHILLEREAAARDRLAPSIHAHNHDNASLSNDREHNLRKFSKPSALLTTAMLAIASALSVWIIVLNESEVAPSRDRSTALAQMTQVADSTCGERERLPAVGPQSRLLRSQGISAFTVANTTGRILDDFVRVVTVDTRGVWLGYHSQKYNSRGLGHFNKTDWADCNSASGTKGMNVNDIAVDSKGHVWVAAEKIGVAMYNGTKWRRFTEKDGLPSSDTFGLTIDDRGDVWVGTWAGVGRFDGEEWSTPYTMSNGTLFDNHVHAIAFDSTGNIWVGHINAGISWYRSSNGTWAHLSQDKGSLAGDDVRAILVRPEKGTHTEQVWIATADGGISVYDRGSWKIFRTEDGILSNEVRDLAVDSMDRLWVATKAGVAYYNDSQWRTYHTLDSFSIAFGPDCKDCPYDIDQVLTGTRLNGLTHSRIPLEEKGVHILKLTYPQIVKPGERFVPEVVVAPIAPYKLREEKGDMLVNTDEDESLLFGAYEHIAVKGTIEPGQAFIFSAADTPMVAPELPVGVNEQTFTSTWRVWMHTRYVGDPVRIVFTVRR